jgi:hypothetical protein
MILIALLLTDIATVRQGEENAGAIWSRGVI